MAIRRWYVATALGAAAAGALVAAPALAAPVYPPATAALTVSATRVAPGGGVSIHGAGFEPGSHATVTIRAADFSVVDDFSVTADDSGAIDSKVWLTRSGTNTITITGIAPGGAPRTVVADVLVTAPAEAAPVPPSASLPNTGAHVLGPLTLGGILVLGGAGALLLGRRRRRRATT
jgi:LPXTG-motif cell wall-anchored protein